MKTVYGDKYFCVNAIYEISTDIKDIYEQAVMKVAGEFRHNVVKVDRNLHSVTLLWYPHLDECAHPFLKESLHIPVTMDGQIKYRRESRENPVILHRLEEMLNSCDPRIPALKALTAEEEGLGLYLKAHIKYIGRRCYWNHLCLQANLIESLSPEEPTVPQQLMLDGIDMHPIIQREATAIKSTRPSAPTLLAHSKGMIQSTVLDWGCGKGRDSQWLRSMGYETISYDPFYKPEPNPRQIDFDNIRTILLNYVLNVIESPLERQKLLEEIRCFARQGTYCIISVRKENEIKSEALRQEWQAYNDGYITSKKTFQKGYTRSELKELCNKVFGNVTDLIEIQGGIVCVVSITRKSTEHTENMG